MGFIHSVSVWTFFQRELKFILFYCGKKLFSLRCGEETAKIVYNVIVKDNDKSGWPSGLRRCVQVAVHFCGRGFESHFWHKIFLGKINIFVGWLYPLKCPPHGSRVAQWKRAGPITQRSVDRNYALLNVFFKNWKSTIFWPKIYIHLFWRSKFFTST